MSQIVVYTQIPVPFPEFAEWLRRMHVLIMACLFGTFIAWIAWERLFFPEPLKPRKAPDDR
jgi:hypothetical protein